MDKKNQITEGVIWKQLLIFFFPIMVGTLFQQLYNTVDAIIVGRFVGKQALASVGGSAAVLTNFVIGFFTGLSAGATVIISQFYGAKNLKQLSKGLHTAYAFSITVSLLISVIGWFATPALLHLLKTPTDVIPDSILYLRIYFLGMTFTLTYNMGSSIMRAIGDSRRPLIYLVICCGINIVLDILFVIVFHMGIAGAAIATVISQGASAILVTRSLMKSYGILKLELRSIRFHGALLKSELKIGLPGGIQSFGYSISNIIIQAVINDFGTDTAAAWAAYGKLDAIFWTVCGSFGIAITTFAGQNYGARKFDRVKKSVRVCLGMALGVCGSLIVFLMVFCRPLYHIFTTDYAVVDIGVYMLRLITPSYVIFIFVEIFSGALRGIGDVLIPSTITLGGVLLVRLTWILFVTLMTGELSTLLYSYPLAWGATALLLIPYYFHRRKQILVE
ncbi:MAG: MATE family efflux transporter [Lachnospiraceae bacterium]|nr:MATE family efflux transporter [Lachnospiraceae bacterium]